MPAAPVIGPLSSSVFTAFDDQNGTGITGSGAPSVTIQNAGALAFGWTGTNNGTHTGTTTNPVFNTNGTYTAGLVSVYTNKIIANDVAEVGFVQTATTHPLHLGLHAPADLHGPMQTTTTAHVRHRSYDPTTAQRSA